MSVALFVLETELATFNKQVQESLLDKRLSLVIYSSSDNSTYPINKLRNLAIKDSKTTHFWLTDLDMWPSRRIVYCYSVHIS